MTTIERVLHERAEDFAHALTALGFSDAEAARFVAEAGPALVRSYEWHTASLGTGPLTREDTREVLGGMPGRKLAHRIGLPERKAWDGLREFVPAVLRASGTVGLDAVTGPLDGRARPSASDEGRFEVGFGLTFDRFSMRKQRGVASEEVDGGDGKRAGVTHPIFSRLLSLHE